MRIGMYSWVWPSHHDLLNRRCSSLMKKLAVGLQAQSGFLLSGRSHMLDYTLLVERRTDGTEVERSFVSFFLEVLYKSCKVWNIISYQLTQLLELSTGQLLGMIFGSCFIPGHQHLSDVSFSLLYHQHLPDSSLSHALQYQHLN